MWASVLNEQVLRTHTPRVMGAVGCWLGGGAATAVEAAERQGMHVSEAAESGMLSTRTQQVWLCVSEHVCLSVLTRASAQVDRWHVQNGAEGHNHWRVAVARVQMAHCVMSHTGMQHHTLHST